MVTDHDLGRRPAGGLTVLAAERLVAAAVVVAASAPKYCLSEPYSLGDGRRGSARRTRRAVTVTAGPRTPGRRRGELPAGPGAEGRH